MLKIPLILILRLRLRLMLMVARLFAWPARVSLD
jgi:hypothetical protein